jgi:hypothetical protein
MPFIVWSQFANAMTMISPFIAWFNHRKNKSETDNKCKITRLLLLHIPVSFCYHLMSAIQAPRKFINMLKITDLSFIHYYAMKVGKVFHQNKKNKLNYDIQLYKLSNTINTLCIIRVCQGNDDTLLRITGLYVCSYNALRGERTINEVSVIGLLSSLLFYYDDNLNKVGHPLFHIFLGVLHHKILKLL